MEVELGETSMGVVTMNWPRDSEVHTVQKVSGSDLALFFFLGDLSRKTWTLTIGTLRLKWCEAWSALGCSSGDGKGRWDIPQGCK